MKTKIAILSVVFLFSTFSAYCQREADVHAKYTHSVSDDEVITLAEAKRIVIANAKAQAIMDEFGTMVTSDVIIRNETNEKTEKSSLVEDIQVLAKGDWLGDTQPAEFNIEYDKENKLLIFTAEVWGRARETVQAQVEFDWKIIKESPSSKSESLAFRNRDKIFIRFKTPASGYLAIYLLQGTDEASCLLPYAKNKKGIQEVVSGTEYVFFDKLSDESAVSYRLSTDMKVEDNQIVVIFSPNPFTKCNDLKSDPRRPNYLNTKDFQKWLLKCQHRDKDMVVAKKWVSITRDDI